MPQLRVGDLEDLVFEVSLAVLKQGNVDQPPLDKAPQRKSKKTQEKQPVTAGMGAEGGLNTMDGHQVLVEEVEGGEEDEELPLDAEVLGEGESEQDEGLQQQDHDDQEGYVDEELKEDSE